MARIPSSPPAAAPHDLVLVGRFGAAHGVRGEIRLKSFTGDPAAIGDYAPLLSQDGSRLFVLRTLRHVRDDMFVARVEGIADRNAAEALRGARIFVARSNFPQVAKDEYYWVDLIGLDVINRQDEALGVVRELLSTGAQTVLVIEYPDESGKVQERMIPFVSAYVDDVDLKARHIRVDWQKDY